ncbi:peroxiredoxin [Pararhizobium mangrovi]|uniref:Glutathione-dependent peroxiredoxin n=1 Tax=Pararhizobium mangrovi TaxID=2590452 RepID=A0A506U2W2_9HYPH|nr:peroxiredoxin [Pararhizobium mangrovi]TPW28702.1 peroxiredoxin [Pararhizobium mangrovi]
MTISSGDRLPEAAFKERTSEGMRETTTEEIFAGRKVVLFAVPGAFTPTCDLNHLPGYIEHNGAIRAKGVDEIAVVAVNDAFVMGAWAEHSGGKDKVRFLSDWDASFTKAIGMETDLSGGTLGLRSKRYAMIVEDGVVKTLNIEETPGTAEKSGAAAILEQL